jgi:membrane protease YdiL (CAAX protease family)
MLNEISSARRITILIGLALALVLPLVLPYLGLQEYAEHTLELGPLIGREVIWWGLVAVLLLYILIVERRTLASIGLHKPDWKTFAFGVGGAVVMLVGVAALINIALPLLHLQRNADALQKIMDTPYWYRVVLVFRAAIAEEILFRGYGIERIQELTGSRFIAGAVTLAAFTLGHLSYWGWAQVLIAGSAGLVLTVLYLWRRDLGANMIVHFLADAVGVLTR